MKCKVCDLECRTMMTMEYCNGTSPWQRKPFHYTRHFGSKDYVDIFKFGNLEIQLRFELTSDSDIPDDVFVIRHLSADDYIDLNISRDSFMSMNFDPKNPQDIINRLNALKSFY